MLSFERASELISYNRETGELRWRVDRSGGVKAGDVAGSRHVKRDRVYVRVVIDGKKYLAHRVAWLLVTGKWPSAHVDHKDNDPTNGRWLNLRLATFEQNARNRKTPVTNTSGFKGVTRYRNKWRATIYREGRNRFLGDYDSPESAYAAYCDAVAELHGEFARVA